MARKKLQDLKHSIADVQDVLVKEKELAHPSLGNRISDRIVKFVGSWWYIVLQTALVSSWLVFNVEHVFFHFDPYPFILLNLIFSFLAGYQAPLILMAQNRADIKAKQRAENTLRLALLAHADGDDNKKQLERIYGFLKEKFPKVSKPSVIEPKNLVKKRTLPTRSKTAHLKRVPRDKTKRG